MDGNLPMMYLLPTTVWDDTSTKLFCDRSYEFCINISEKNMPLLEKYHFNKVVEHDFMNIQSTINFEFLIKIKNYLESKGLQYNDTIDKAIVARKAGKEYSLSDHVRGLIYSLMTNQTEWVRVVPHLREVDKVFLNYNVEKLKAANPNDLCKGLFDIKCGNRQSVAQIKALYENIITFEKIVQDFGCMDAFVTSESANKIVEQLSDSKSKYKLRQVGAALAWEYLRNVGIDGAKLDTHLRRFFGNDRIGNTKYAPAKESEVIAIVSQLSEQTGLSMAAIDNLIWSYCAEGFGEICTVNPKCDKCIIKEFCKKNN